MLQLHIYGRVVAYNNSPTFAFDVAKKVCFEQRNKDTDNAMCTAINVNNAMCTAINMLTMVLYCFYLVNNAMCTMLNGLLTEL